MPHARLPANEHLAVRRQDPPEAGVRLQRGDQAVEAERDEDGPDPQPPAVLPHALPYQPRPADLRDRGEGEQDERLRDGHAGRLQVQSLPEGSNGSAIDSPT